MNKLYLIVSILICACNNSGTNNQTAVIQKDSTPVIQDSVPMSYDQLMAEQNQMDTQFTEYSAKLMFKHVFPGKTPKTINDFSSLETKDLRTAYKKLLKVCFDYRDSGKMYTEQIEKIYSALDSKLEASDQPENPLPIGDKLNITDVKSDINTEIAGMKMRQKSK